MFSFSIDSNLDSSPLCLGIKIHNDTLAESLEEFYIELLFNNSNDRGDIVRHDIQILDGSGEFT